MSAYYIPGTILSTGDTLIGRNENKAHLFMNLKGRWGIANNKNRKLQIIISEMQDINMGVI